MDHKGLLLTRRGLLWAEVFFWAEKGWEWTRVGVFWAGV